MPSHSRAVEPFGTVLIAVVLVAIVVSCLTFLGNGAIYRGLGRSGLSLDQSDVPPGPPPGSPAAEAEAREEVRQMLEAKSARRQARGEPALDVDAELAALLSTPSVTHDAALREEVRQLVVARNERRQRRGEEPLDVEAEVRRSLDALGG